MGAVSRSRLQEVFVGSTAERVLDRIGCDVLVVKPARFHARSCRSRTVRQACRGVPPAACDMPHTRQAPRRSAAHISGRRGRTYTPRHMSHTNVLLVSAEPADHAAVARGARRHSRPAVPTRRPSARWPRRSRPCAPGASTRSCSDLNLPDSLGVTTFLRLQPKATNVPVVVLVAERTRISASRPWSAARSTTSCRARSRAQLVDKVLRYATERTHTLKALKASEQRYRELFQNVTAGVFQTTVDGKFMAANPALVRMLGYDSEDELLAVDVARDVYAEPEPPRPLGQGDGGARRGAQRRAACSSARTAASSWCWRTRARCATPTAACCSTRARSPTSPRRTRSPSS